MSSAVVWDRLGYYIQLGIALWMIYTASTKPIDDAVIWVGTALFVVIRTEGKRIRQAIEESRDG